MSNTQRSTISSRREADNQTRRRYILDAARRLYEEKGVDAVGMDDIAAAADYTRRTLYAYFKGRDDISLMVLIEDNKARWAEQQEALDRAKTGLGKVLAWAAALHDFTRRHPHSIRLQLYWDFRDLERTTVGPETFAAFEAINDELAEGLREIFRLGVRDRSLRPDLEIDLTISQFLYCFRAILNRALSNSYSFASFDPDQYVAHYLEGFTGNIKNSGVRRVRRR